MFISSVAVARTDQIWSWSTPGTYRLGQRAPNHAEYGPNFYLPFQSTLGAIFIREPYAALWRVKVSTQVPKFSTTSWLPGVGVGYGRLRFDVERQTYDLTPLQRWAEVDRLAS